MHKPASSITHLVNGTQKLTPFHPLSQTTPVSVPASVHLAPLHVIPSIHVLVAPPFSSASQEAQVLQAKRIVRSSMPGDRAYLETADFARERTIPLVVRRRKTGELIGTVRSELAKPSIIEVVVQFSENTAPSHGSRQETFAVVRGFSTSFDLECTEVLNISDTLHAAIIRLAEQRGYASLLLFPHRTLKSLLRARIPGVLPPIGLRSYKMLSAGRSE